MKKNFVRTIILAGSLLLQLSTLCFYSRGAAGDVDLSFNPGSGVNGVVNVIALQPDGKIIIGGQFTAVDGLQRTNIARLNANGSGDPTFNPATGYYAVSSLALQSDGKILVAGHVARLECDSEGCDFFYDIFVTRLNANGTMDAGFIPATGICDYYGPDVGSSVVTQSDGKVIIGGNFRTMNGIDRGGIARLQANGTLDASFNPTGIEGLFPNVFSVVALSDDKLLIGGSFNTVNGVSRSSIARLNANGSLDSGFNPAPFRASLVTSVVLQPDGKMLIGGYYFEYNGVVRGFAVARLDANGSLDSIFNPGGGPNGRVNAVALQADGKVLIGGYFSAVNGSSRNRIARLNANGSVDTTFNPGTGFGGSPFDPNVRSIALQPDGNVLIGGEFTTVNGVVRPYLARLYGDAAAPSLNIARSNAFVIVSWPASGLNFQLQENTNLLLPNAWSPVAQPAVTNLAQVSVTVPAGVGPKFFRLKSQSGTTLYGTTMGDGNTGYGQVFKVNTNGTGFTKLHNFDGFDGGFPEAGLILSGNTLYGTTSGYENYGTVFAINTDGTGFRVVHVFYYGDGAWPRAGLILSGDILYGTTTEGGGLDSGTVFAVNTNGTGFTTLHNFTATNSDGAYPRAGLILSGNTLYGTAGTVFRINTDGSGFTNFGIGAGPGGLILSGNTLYGTTFGGGSSSHGTVFALNTNGTGFKNLYGFPATSPFYPSTNSAGANPRARLILSGGTLYGTAANGGTGGVGTVFAVNIDGTGFLNLHNFGPLDGRAAAYPLAGLILSGTTLYGTTERGGNNGDGTVFSLSLPPPPPPPPQLTIIRSGANFILKWATNTAGFTLQSTTNLVSPVVWITNFPAPVIINGQNTVTNPAVGAQKFFRLKSQ